MEAYYDSDDDVAWGPITLREIKRTFRDPPVKRIDKRQTTHIEKRAETPKYFKKASEIEEKMDREEVLSSEVSSLSSEVLQKCNVTSSSSEYCTPNETVSTAYVSCVADHLRNHNTLDLITYESSATELRNIRQTLVENSFSCDSLDSSSVETVNSSTYTQSFENSIIVLSSDDEDSFIKSKIKTEKRTSRSSSSVNDSKKNAEPADEFVSLGDSSSSSEAESNKSEVYNTNACTADTRVTLGSEPPRNTPNFSPVEVPEISLASFDDSGSLELNNTFDEIERMLNTSISPTHSSNSSKSSPSEVPVHLTSPLSIISVTPNNTDTKFQMPDSESVTPSRTFIKSKIPTSTKVCVENKVPNKQFRIPKTPAKLTTINCKNIVSPVGMYIKYGKTCPLMQNLNPSSMSKNASPLNTPKTQDKILSKENKENFTELPPVVYKPAAKKHYKIVEKLVLPPSIDKMVTKCEVIRHEKRIVSERAKEDVQRKLEMETDLTKSSIGESFLNDSNDISVLVSKPGYNVK